MAAAQLPRDPIPPPPARLQPQHLRYVVRRLHHLPSWIAPQRALRDSLLVHSLSPQLSQGGAIPRDAEGAIFHGARQRPSVLTAQSLLSHHAAIPTRARTAQIASCLVAFSERRCCRTVRLASAACSPRGAAAA